MPPETITAFLDHGKVRATLEEDISEARRIFVDLEAAGINMESVTGMLLDKGVRAFIESFDKLLVGITEKSSLLTRGAS